MFILKVFCHTTLAFFYHIPGQKIKRSGHLAVDRTCSIAHGGWDEEIAAQFRAHCTRMHGAGL